MYDIEVYDSNITQNHMYMYYDTSLGKARCVFQVLDVCRNCVSMRIQPIATYDDYNRSEFWKNRCDFEDLYEIKKVT